MAGFVLFGPTHHLLVASLRLRSLRHELLAANVANADTPGYRPRDLDFQGVLEVLLPHPPKGKVRLVATHPLHQGPPDGGLLAGGVEGEARLDQNRVDLDQEMTHLVENTLLYETSLTLLSRKLAGLRYAVEEGRR